MSITKTLACDTTCMRTVSLVAGVDQAGEARGSSLASGERLPCCLLPQFWRGEPPAASHWWGG